MGRVLLYVHRNNPAIWDGKPRTATSTSTQFLSWVGAGKLSIPDATLSSPEWPIQALRWAAAMSAVFNVSIAVEEQSRNQTACMNCNFRRERTAEAESNRRRLLGLTAGPHRLRKRPQGKG